MKIIPLIVVLVKRSALQMKVKVMLVKIQFKMKLEVRRRLMIKSWKTIGQRNSYKIRKKDFEEI